jgi:hypothetical protein
VEVEEIERNVHKGKLKANVRKTNKNLGGKIKAASKGERKEIGKTKNKVNMHR